MRMRPVILSTPLLVIFFHVELACGFSVLPSGTCHSTRLAATTEPLRDPLYSPDGEDDNFSTFEDEDTPCDILARYGNDDSNSKFLFILSDSTGATAKAAVTKTLAQFDSCDDRFFYSDLSHDEGDDNASPQDCSVQTRVFTFIRGEAAVAAIIKKAQEKEALVVFTIVEPVLRELTLQMCLLSNVQAIDLLGPTLAGLSEFLGKNPIGVPQHMPKRVALSDSYYRRIQAVEFTLKADDGQSPWLLGDADVVIVGVSRTGKTPLSVVLSQTMGLKVANVPLVLECPAAKELFSVNPDRVFCLTIAPSELKRIRKSRLERRGVKDVELKYDFDPKHNSNYADRAYLLKDLKHARALAAEYDWTEIDVTGRAVEETASFISELMNERFEEMCL